MKLKNRMKRRKNSRKKAFINGHLRLEKIYLLIPLSIFILLSMGVGFAILTDKLNIKNDNSIEIVNISTYSKTIGATNLYEPSYSETDPSFNLCLLEKTDYITYLITIKNNSNKSKKLNNIFIRNSNNSDITYELQDININDIIPANTGTSFKIKIKYKDEISTITNKCIGMNIDFNFIDYN